MIGTTLNHYKVVAHLGRVVTRCLADAFTPPREAEPKAKIAAVKALELANVEAHNFYGIALDPLSPAPNFFNCKSLVTMAYREKEMFVESVAEYRHLQQAMGGRPLSGLGVI